MMNNNDNKKKGIIKEIETTRTHSDFYSWWCLSLPASEETHDARFPPISDPHFLGPAQTTRSRHDRYRQHTLPRHVCPAAATVATQPRQWDRVQDQYRACRLPVDLISSGACELFENCHYESLFFSIFRSSLLIIYQAIFKIHTLIILMPLQIGNSVLRPVRHSSGHIRRGRFRTFPLM